MSRFRHLRPLFSTLLIAWLPGFRTAYGKTIDGALLEQGNCSACHTIAEKQSAWLLPQPAPKLADIGSRVSANWLQHFLEEPHKAMPGTTMPDMLRGNKESAEALTHYLVASGHSKFRRVTPDKAAVARGESLYHRIGCVACHAPLNGTPAPPDSVPLPAMTEKWAQAGLAKFLLDPVAVHPSGRMPAMHLTNDEASDIAHFLLRDTRVPAKAEAALFKGRARSLQELDDADIARTMPADGFSLEALTRERYDALRIRAWLNIGQAGEYTFHLSAIGMARIIIDGQQLLQVEKPGLEKAYGKNSVHLDAGQHEIKAEYITRPRGSPTLTLEWEANGMERGPIPSALLSSEREPVTAAAPFVLDPAKVEKGRALYASLNCATCHEGKPPTKTLPALAALNLSRGCLADSPPIASPEFHFTASQRDSLRETLATLNDSSLPAPTPQERLAHTMESFRCTHCHARDGKGGVTAERGPFFTSNVDDLGDEGRLPPKLTGVGDKLRPEWLNKVLHEGASVRPYLNTRMPQFGKGNVGHLAALFVELDRHAAPLAPVSDAPEVLREAGRKLVGTDGLSCIACHRFNRQPAQSLQVLDLLATTERLNEDWFRRFLRDPNKFNPGTRMLMFWPGGQSLIPSVLDGNIERQHAALWTYLADGPKAKFPEGLSRQNSEITVGGEAVVYRGKLWEAGFRAVATGYPGQLNAAFDAEEMRLALLWRGRFLNAGPHWEVQGMGRLRPLGTDVVVFPHGSPLAVLPDKDAPWPEKTAKELGMKFGGYYVDAQKRPTFFYEFENVRVDDFMAPPSALEKPAFHRILRLRGNYPQGLHLRVAAGKLTPQGAHAWRMNDVITIHDRMELAFARGEGDKQELLIPLWKLDSKAELEIDYVW